MGKEKKMKKVEKKKAAVEADMSQKVKMKFSEDKFYNDLNKPMFLAGEIYELEGAGWIQRWLKRGGEIVEGEMPLPPQDEPNPSEIVDKDSKVETDVEKEETTSDTALDMIEEDAE